MSFIFSIQTEILANELNTLQAQAPI